MDDWREKYDELMEKAVAGAIDAVAELYRIQGQTPFRDRLRHSNDHLLAALQLRLESNREKILTRLAVGASVQIGERRYQRVDQFTVLATSPNVTLEIPQRGQP